MKLGQDQLGKITDEELNSRFRTVRNLIENKKNSKDKIKQLEIEFCYLVREKEIRSNRKNAHDNFLKAQNNKFRYNRRSSRSNNSRS